MEIIDSKRKCCVEGCENLGEWNRVVNGKVYRRRRCYTHTRLLRPHTAKQRLKLDKHKVCEYCGWEGPCDIHRPNPGSNGGQYTKDNCRSICPNCHRLISYGLIVDKFRDVQKSEHIV